MTIQITGIDHMVLNVSDVDRSLDFYCGVLGLGVERLEQFRKGEINFPSVRINEDTIIDLMRAPGSPLGEGDPRNLNHYCLVAKDVDFTELVDSLRKQNVTILQEARARWGAHGRAESIYILDPDGNQIEIKSY